MVGGSEMLEEPLAGSGGAHGGTPSLAGHFAHGVAGEGQQVQRGKYGGEVLLAVPESVFQVIVFGFQGVKRLVFDLPACLAAGSEFRYSVAAHRQVGDEAVAVGQLAGGIEDLDHEPVDLQGVIAVPQRYLGQPATVVSAPFAADLDPGCQFSKRDAGAVFLDGLVRGGLAEKMKCAPASSTA